MTDNDYLVANKTLRSSELSLLNKPQNSSATKRALLPLEPDFSQISDPSIVIALLSNTWVSDNRHTSTRHSRRNLPKDKHKTKKREDTDYLLPPLLDPLQLLTREAEGPRGQIIHTKGEEGVRSRHFLLRQIIPFMIMEDIKEQEYLRRLQKFQVLCNLLGLWIRHRLYIRIMWCKKQRTRILNQIRKPGPLTGY